MGKFLARLSLSSNFTWIKIICHIWNEVIESFVFLFLFSSAASGNIQIVQLLCELKSPINVKDAVRAFIITFPPHTYFFLA